MEEPFCYQSVSSFVSMEEVITIKVFLIRKKERTLVPLGDFWDKNCIFCMLFVHLYISKNHSQGWTFKLKLLWAVQENVSMDFRELWLKSEFFLSLSSELVPETQGPCVASINLWQQFSLCWMYTKPLTLCLLNLIMEVQNSPNERNCFPDVPLS